jgi:hypothetical protein
MAFLLKNLIECLPFRMGRRRVADIMLHILARHNGLPPDRFAQPPHSFIASVARGDIILPPPKIVTFYLPDREFS